MSRKKSGIVILGTSSLATSFAATVVGGSPVLAATPSCDAAATPSQNTARVTSANAGLSSAFLATSGKSLHADTLKKELAFKKAKGAAKTSALKAWNTAKAKEATALAAYKRLNAYSIFTSSPVSGTAVSRNGSLWTWGDYTTQVVIKGGKLIKTCTSVDESSAGSTTGDKPTDVDANTSKSTYQGIGSWNADAPGNLEILFHAATYAPATSVSKIQQNVQTCSVQAWDNTSAPCIYGGISTATYTADAFKKSLTAALAKAKTAGAISN